MGFCSGFFFSFFLVLSAMWFPPPCIHAQQHCTGQLSRLRSVILSSPIAFLWRGPWRSPAMPDGRPSLTSHSFKPFDEANLLSPLSTLPSPLSPACPRTVFLLHRVLSAGRPRAMAISDSLSRASGPLPCPPTCRLTWAASPVTPSGGLPHRPPPLTAPPSVP